MDEPLNSLDSVDADMEDALDQLISEKEMNQRSKDSFDDGKKQYPFFVKQSRALAIKLNR